jgi:hypothetical protein
VKVVKVFNKKGSEITSVENWLELAPPVRKEFHWKPGRSAYELANAWIGEERVKALTILQDILNSSENLQNIELIEAFAEWETKLDKHGKGRTHDFLIKGQLEEKKAIIAIEAKADESFGELIGNYMEKSPEQSNIPNRIKLMASALFEDQSIDDLRYQLLHGVAGTLIEAKNQQASVAVFIVHQFISDSLSQSALQKNNDDLNSFVSRLINQNITLTAGNLVGPITVIGGTTIPNSIPIYIGKIISNV